ncbi:unnamed protein product [Microthlaspi erraticum]|uniref:Uncharacterized protein n=1 Tax=Microthlaspi erraticum TaxID=1685480 RepID=A0A6D2I5C5_9BRAS|nr:unnamed protein product [Microthlaspi erraticum]
MRESSHRPLIFGTPFLSTVGAIFDFPNQRISFNKVNKGMFFPMCSTKNSFVDMVQEEKVTLKPPQEGETEDTIKEDPIPKPKQLANKQGVRLRPLHQNRPRDHPRLKMRPSQEEGICAKGHSWRDCLSSCESPTRYSLQGEKTWRIKDASCLHLLLSAKPYSQAKDLKQALHGRQPMRIEGEKGVKTQSAPNIGRGRAKVILAEQISNRADHGRAGKERLARPDYIARQKRRAARTTRKKQAAIGRILYRNGPTVRSIRETNDRPRPKFSSIRNLADQIARPRQIHRPSAQNFSRPRYPMAKTKGNESMKKKKNPFMEPPKKQIKLGSSSSNARAAIPTSPHSIDAIKNMWRVQEEEKMIGHL